jgi:hypothetical protein
MKTNVAEAENSCSNTDGTDAKANSNQQKALEHLCVRNLLKTP